METGALKRNRPNVSLIISIVICGICLCIAPMTVVMEALMPRNETLVGLVQPSSMSAELIFIWIFLSMQIISGIGGIVNIYNSKRDKKSWVLWVGFIWALVGGIVCLASTIFSWYGMEGGVSAFMLIINCLGGIVWFVWGIVYCFRKIEWTWNKTKIIGTYCSVLLGLTIVSYIFMMTEQITGNWILEGGVSPTGVTYFWWFLIEINIILCICGICTVPARKRKNTIFVTLIMCLCLEISKWIFLLLIYVSGGAAAIFILMQIEGISWWVETIMLIISVVLCFRKTKAKAANMEGNIGHNITNPSLRNAAYILSVIDTVLFSWLLIPLAWNIPMTLAYKKSISDTQKHTTLGICSIIFQGPLGVIAGILMLCSGGENPVIASQRQTNNVTPVVVNQTYSHENIADTLRKYHDLYKDGAISQEEYDAKKAKLLE